MKNKEETTMERKIGEIFEYNGEWCQCVEQPEDYIGDVCKICNFNGTGNCELDRCSGTYRSDHKYVIFKKLEKVGEPIIYMSRTFQKLKSPDTKQCKYCYFVNQVCNPHLCGEELFLVEIKQNKEDMEENELIELLSEKVHNAWMKEKEAQGFSYGKEYDKEKKKHPDMLPYNELKEEVKEYDRATVKAVLQAQKELSADVNKLNLKPFSIEAAKAGKPVCTRDGRKARIIYFDAEGNKPLIVLSKIDGKEVILRYTEKGQSDNFHSPTPREDDLMMLPETKEGWINVYKRRNEHICENECSVSTGITVYKSESEAKRNICEDKICVDTVKITWEE